MKKPFNRHSQTHTNERFAAKFQLIDTNLEEGTFRGIASVFGSLVDTYPPTIIEQGAFSRTLRERKRKVKLLWQHDPSRPIGVPTEIRETEQGLEIVGKISQTQDGKDALVLLRDGVVDELSIGFDPIKWETINGDGSESMRHLKEVRLWEVSLVTFAADPNAKITAVHERQNKPPVEIPDEALMSAPDMKKCMAQMSSAMEYCDEALEAEGMDETNASVTKAKSSVSKSMKIMEGYAEQAVDLTAVLEKFKGAVISKKNKQRLKDALTALQDLLAQQPDDEETEIDDDSAAVPPGATPTGQQAQAESQATEPSAEERRALVAPSLAKLAEAQIEMARLVLRP